MTSAREPSPILCKRRWERRALALLWPRAQVIGIDVSATGIQHQKQLFDAIDGKRTINDIAPLAARRDAARLLFEGLW